MDTNLNVLDEINKGCSMGIEAIDMILKKNDEYGFHDLNVEYYDKYVELSDKIIKLYHEYTEEEIHKANTMEKMMTWYGIMKDTILDGEMFINGRPFKDVSSNLNCLWDKAIEERKKEQQKEAEKKEQEQRQTKKK